MQTSVTRRKGQWLVSQHTHILASVPNLQLMGHMHPKIAVNEARCICRSHYNIRSLGVPVPWVKGVSILYSRAFSLKEEACQQGGVLYNEGWVCCMMRGGYAEWWGVGMLYDEGWVAAWWGEGVLYGEGWVCCIVRGKCAVWWRVGMLYDEDFSLKRLSKSEDKTQLHRCLITQSRALLVPSRL